MFHNTRSSKLHHIAGSSPILTDLPEHIQRKILLLLRGRHLASISSVNSTLRNVVKRGLANHRRDPWAMDIAVNSGWDDTVRELLNAGASPHILLDNSPRQALHCACRRGKLNVAKVLIEYGAAPWALDVEKRYSPAHYAVLHDHPHIIRWLYSLEKKHQSGWNGSSYERSSHPLVIPPREILQFALRSHSSVPIIETIVSIAIETGQGDECICDSLELASISGRSNVLYTVMRYIAPPENRRRFVRNTDALIHACRAQSIPCLRVLFGGNAICPSEYPELLTTAVTLNDNELVNFLVHEMGMSVDISYDASNGTDIMPPLIAAIRNNNVAMVEFLINHGAELFDSHINGLSIMCCAAASGNRDMVRLLVRARANANAVDGAGMSPLCYAINHNDIDMAEILIKAGCSVNAQCPFQIEPLHYAAEAQNRNEFILYLIERGANLASPFASRPILCSAVKYSSVEVVLKLLSLGVNPDGPFSRGNCCPLISAIEAKRVEIVRALLKNNVDPNVTAQSSLRRVWPPPIMPYESHYESTPLHAAARFGLCDIIQLLVDAGVCLDRKCLTEGRHCHGYLAKCCAPLHLAAINHHIDAVRLLLEAKASIDVKDETGMTPLHCACIAGCMATIRLLLESGADYMLSDNSGKTAMMLLEENTSVPERARKQIMDLIKSS